MAHMSLLVTAATASAVTLLSCIGPILAQEMQTAPRTPMSPGSTTFGKTMIPQRGQDSALWGSPLGVGAYPQMAPPQILMPQKSPDLSGLDSAAIEMVSTGDADVVVSSRASTELILQLYRPDQNQWQEFRLAPASNTPIACVSCGGKLKFSFNDGAQNSEVDVEAPAMLRIFPDATGTRWQWDVLKLQSATRPQ